MEIIKFKGEIVPKTLPDDIFFTKEDIAHFNGDQVLFRSIYYSRLFVVPSWDLANAEKYAKNCYKAWIKHVEECLNTGRLKVNKELWLKLSSAGLKQPHSETTA